MVYVLSKHRARKICADIGGSGAEPSHLEWTGYQLGRGVEQMDRGYQDRFDAGRQLATHLQAYANRPDVLILALPRG